MQIWNRPQYGEGKAMLHAVGRKKVAEWSSGGRKKVCPAEDRKAEKSLGV